MANNIKLDVNADVLVSHLREFQVEAKKAIEDGVKNLSAIMYTKAQELASNKLKTTAEKYKKALSQKEISEGIWMVSLDESALFIEDGMSSGSMIESLLKTGYKVSRDGVKYRSIPFEYSGQSKNQSQNTQSLVNAIKSEMRERKIPFKKIEYDASGSPRIGKIHSFDIESKKPSPNSKSPALHGVTISQAKNATTGKVEQKITTFRTVSEKSSGWVHPGLEAKNILDESLEYAEDFWERTLLPEIMAKFDK